VLPDNGILSGMVKPISLRIRSAEATRKARELLSKLDERDRLRCRMRWFATKALVSIHELHRDAAKLDRWQAEIELVETTLQKISKASR
jgi:hypothetical protein